jgi:hypothetical protein
MRVSRREFLKVGAGAAMTLAVTHALNRPLFAQPVGGGSAGSLDLKHFANRDAELIAALAPAILADALPLDPASRQVAINEVVEAFDRTIFGLSPAVQREVDELMSLLTFAPTRYLIAGIRSPWNAASAEEIDAFLQRWRDSRLALLQQGYQALVRLMIACWYGNPLAWAQIGYPGPPHAREFGLQ